MRELEIWGTRLHLTGRERLPDVLAEQISDSISMLELAEEVLGENGEEVSVADIGAGAGFPGVVWKIARPRWRIALFERKEKLAAWLERTISLLSLGGIRVRAEDVRLDYEGEKYDMITSKASGRFGEMLPLAKAMVGRGGIYVTAKGEGWEEELANLAGSRFDVVLKRGLDGGRGEALALRLE